MLAQPAQSATVLDAEALFARHARRLHAVVIASVRTSAANVDDACGFAWLQLVRHRPPAGVAFAWLCTTAVREAIKLHGGTIHAIGLDQVAEVAADRTPGPESSLALIAADEQVRAPRLRSREAHILGLSAAGYTPNEIAELTADSRRTVDR